MECRIIGEKYLILDNYDFIHIFKNKNNEEINVVIETSNKDDIRSLLDSSEFNNKLLNWNVIKHFSDIDIIEEVISNFLVNNIINKITEMKGNENFDYSFLVSSIKNRMLKIELGFVLDNFLREYFKKNVALRILAKYKKDCLQFFHEHNDKKIYCFDGSDILYNAQFFTSLVGKSKISNILADDLQNQEVVIVKDGITNKFELFEERLNLEKDKAYLEELDNLDIKVTCNDNVFIFLSTISTPFNNFNAKQNVKDIVLKHNQSIEKGRRLLMELESGKNDS